MFDYMDRRVGGYGDRSYDSPSQTTSRPQVVDYNHGSISGSSKSAVDDRSSVASEDRSVTSGRDVDLREVPKEQDRPIATGRDVDLRDMAKDRDWPATLHRDVDERELSAASASRNPRLLEDEAPSASPPRDADVDIKFIQDTIVSVNGFYSVVHALCTVPIAQWIAMLCNKS